jgi:hypothetical protein
MNIINVYLPNFIRVDSYILVNRIDYWIDAYGDNDNNSDDENITTGDDTSRFPQSHDESPEHDHQQEEPIDDCPICLTRCSLQLNYQCNHLFCQACIMQWNQQCRISRKQCLCPLCRSL